ncbi:guanylate kinase [Chromatiales bacterium (ex Bugula neritina AB1)]|nr:guanylate kinase [Chromatiales bacterium (ex Bugula neritina AB1)]
MTAQLYIISAPSGAGKTSLVREACQRLDRLQVSISHTTRPMRPADVDGVDYHFVSVERFHAMLEQCEFLEHAQVFDNYYGTSQKAVEETLTAGIDVILEIDWQGADQVRRLMPDACSIYIVPPSLEILADRLRGRASDSDEVIQRRMRDAVSDMRHFSVYDYLIINDSFDQAIAELCGVILSKRVSVSRQGNENEALLSAMLGG